MLASYREQEVWDALSAAGVTSGSVCIVHASLLKLRRCESEQDLPQVWLNALRQLVGPRGAVILPAFG